MTEPLLVPSPSDVVPGTPLQVYEREVVADIRSWVGREPGWRDRALVGASNRAQRVVDLVLESRRAERFIEQLTTTVLDNLRDVAVRDLSGRVALAPANDRERVDLLRAADERSRTMAQQYAGALGLQGAAAGAASISALLTAFAFTADVGMAVGGALRAGAHQLALYGISPSDPGTLEASVEIGAIAGEIDPAQRRTATLAVVRRILDGDGSDPDRAFPRVLVQQTGTRAIKETAEQTVRRILRRRMAGLVPILGAVASGVSSASLAMRVGEAGRHVGRLTYLSRHAGLDPRGALRGV